MVGNNLSRDVVGANRLGITSIHMAWTERYPRVPADAEQTPDHTITMPDQLLPLLDQIEARLPAPDAPGSSGIPGSAGAALAVPAR